MLLAFIDIQTFFTSRLECLETCAARFLAAELIKPLTEDGPVERSGETLPIESP